MWQKAHRQSMTRNNSDARFLKATSSRLDEALKEADYGY